MQLIADMALENFIEMRDKVGDARFQFKKKVESLIEKTFPQFYRSRYGLITYTLVPYSTAQEVGRKQNEWLDHLVKDLKTPEDLDLSKVESILKTEIDPWLKSKGVKTDSYRPA